jgi:hypothetical protein
MSDAHIIERLESITLRMAAEASLIDLSHRGELALITRIADKMTTDLDLAYSMMATRNGSRL